MATLAKRAVVRPGNMSAKAAMTHYQKTADVILQHEAIFPEPRAKAP